ncbi:hypothetical protein ACFOW6_17830 [Fodinicurvata halophila]|uniref:CopG family transcriptional regulator n=1 Tax=Fodinicurvata halophila TaxID=1419723 RepID=A0ABV8UQ41_9PROT
MAKRHEGKMVRRLNTTLPDPLARYVGEITGKDAPYETPSEFICDLVRRHMERSLEQERGDVRAVLAHSLRENDYADWTDGDLAKAREAASE